MCICSRADTVLFSVGGTFDYGLELHDKNEIKTEMNSVEFISNSIV